MLHRITSMHSTSIAKLIVKELKKHYLAGVAYKFMSKTNFATPACSCILQVPNKLDWPLEE